MISRIKEVFVNLFMNTKSEDKEIDAYWFATQASKDERKAIMDDMARASGEDQRETIEKYRKARSAHS